MHVKDSVSQVARPSAPGAPVHRAPQHLALAATSSPERPRLIRRPVVEARVGIKKGMIYGLMAKGEFPANVKCGPKAVAWIESEVDAWIAARIAASKGGAA